METVLKDVKDANGCKIKPLDPRELPRAEDHTNGDEYSESNSLLPHRRGGISRKGEKTVRKVQWNDKNGNKLVEVLEFEPSDDSDSEDENSDSCICTIM